MSQRRAWKKRPLDRSRTAQESVAMWNFDVAQDTIHAATERSPALDLEAPHPLVEYTRWKEMDAMRTHYGQLCQTHLECNAPAESFNRWLFEQLSIPSEGRQASEDPILAKPSVGIESDVLRRELVADLPCPTYLPWAFRSNTNKVVLTFQVFVQKCMELAQEVLSSTTTSQETTDLANAVLPILKVADEWSKLNHKALLTTASAAFQQLKVTKASCESFIKAYYKPKIDRVIEGVILYSRSISEKLRSVDTTSCGEVDVLTHDNHIAIKFQDDIHKISKSHYNKLKLLYTFASGGKDPSLLRFHSRLYTLLRRYTTFFGPGKGEGASFHAAAPASVFEVLQRDFSVCQESFASPLNCYFKRFCSAFPDIDCFFGSLGSFFDYQPVEGSFETGPPYTEEVMENMALHVERLLASSERPLSFIVFVPDWNDPPARSLEIMASSRFLRGDFVAEGRRHSYVVGAQHLAEATKERFFVLPFGTHVYVLQNEAGAKKWPATPEKLNSIKVALEDHH